MVALQDAFRNPKGYMGNGAPSASKSKAIAQNHLGDQMIGGMRQANAQSEIHLPFRREVQINGRKDLVLLLTDRKKIRGRTDGAIVLESTCNSFREVVAELEVRRKDDSLRHTFAMEERSKVGLKDQYQGPDCLSIIGRISQVHVSVENFRR